MRQHIDSGTLGGVLAVLLNLGLFLGASFLTEQEMVHEMGPFMAAFIISAVYFILILGIHLRKHGWRRFAAGHELNYALALTAFSLSAHLLNMSEIRVFAPYAPWLKGYVIGMHAVLLIMPFRASLPEWLRYTVYTAAGASAVLALYMTIYLGPLILIAIPASIALGLSLHATVPVWFLIEYLLLLRRMGDDRPGRRLFWAGVLVPMMLLAAFTAHWGQIQGDIRAAHTDFQAQAEPLLPEWVHLSQRIPDGAFTEYVLLSGVRQQEGFWNLDLFGSLVAREFEVHEPLAVCAVALFGQLDTDPETMLRLFESRYDARHMTHRRLWSGDQLRTASVETQIQAWPAYRMAYVEQLIEIEHTAEQHSGEQEAVYTFHLPQGGTATSLSLWINGEESRSRLTTRSKADSAYEAIVGIERRDPALLHWQEGNRLTVTVFPCTPEEKRKFRIGVTVPMALRDGELLLEPVWLEGPSLYATPARIRVQTAAPDAVQAPVNWRREDGMLTYSGLYNPDWTLRFPAEAPASETFSFGGYRYQARPLEVQEQPFRPGRVVLDLNRSWTWPETRRVWELVKDREVYVCMPHPVRVLQEEQLRSSYDQLSALNFSVLPLHEIPAPQAALVISKTALQTPLLSDLEHTPFVQALEPFLLGGGQLHWVNLNPGDHALLRTLRETGAIRYAEADAEQLGRWLAAGVFPEPQLAPGQIALADAGILLDRQPDSAAGGSAPDHLARLWSYGHLMQLIGRQYFDRERLEEQWIREAESAYIVSPVSSLVVLESQADYERFGIGENQDTLGNASWSNEGAVPEPHEWALILLTALLVAGYYLKRRFA
ncbi:MAG: XrtN system VIT domain-containing protein [Bacteroidia bacterium]|nr:XrtN system VIT domain-containing protein [Bacteroidia bacterium]